MSDYARGGLKIAARQAGWLYGVDLRGNSERELGLALPTGAIRKRRARLVLGEWWAGAAKGHARAIGVRSARASASGFCRRRLVATGKTFTDARLTCPGFGRFGRGTSSRAAASWPRSARRSTWRDRARARAATRRLWRSSRGRAALGEFVGRGIGRFEPTCLGSVVRSRERGISALRFRDSCPEAARLDRCGPEDRLDEAPLLGASYTCPGSARGS